LNKIRIRIYFSIYKPRKGLGLQKFLTHSHLYSWKRKRKKRKRRKRKKMKRKKRKKKKNGRRNKRDAFRVMHDAIIYPCCSPNNKEE